MLPWVLNLGISRSLAAWTRRTNRPHCCFKLKKKKKSKKRADKVRSKCFACITSLSQRVQICQQLVFCFPFPPVSHPEWLNSVHVKIEGEQIQKDNSQMSLEEHPAQDSEFSIVCADGYIQDLSVESSKTHLLPNSSNQPLETLSDSEAGGLCQPTEESQHITPRTSLKELGIKRKVSVKRKSSHKKTSTLSASQNPTGPHCCKACGKTFYYIYTLRTHVLTHAGDAIHICGICGKHLESTESFVQHIQSHTQRKKCGICGKQFSNYFRLKRHKRFHRPKGLKFKAST